MLTEEEIEKLIEPIVQRQSNLSSAIIYIIAKRIKAIGDIDPDSLYTIEQALRTSTDVASINKMITEVLQLQLIDVDNIFHIIAKDTYESSKELYYAIGREFVNYEESIQMQRITNAIAKLTNDEFRELYKTQAFMLRNPMNPAELIPTSASETYNNIVNEALSDMTINPKGDYYDYIERTMKQLNESGLRTVVYHTESGKEITQRLDTAVRRNVLDGIRAVNQEIQNQVGLEIGADGVELSIHEYPAPDHAPIQGHQFTKVEYDKLQNGEPFEDVNGKKFEAIERPIGAWNCRHFAWNILVGISSPNRTEEQLQEILDRNERGYTTKNGKHLTMYECTQVQRQYELGIRKAIEGMNMSEIAGDMKLYSFYKTRYMRLSSEYTTFSKDCGLYMNPRRIRVLQE